MSSTAEAAACCPESRLSRLLFGVAAISSIAMRAHVQASGAATTNNGIATIELTLEQAEAEAA